MEWLETGKCPAMKAKAACADLRTCAHMGERLNVAKFKPRLKINKRKRFFLETNALAPFSKS